MKLRPIVLACAACLWTAAAVAAPPGAAGAGPSGQRLATPQLFVFPWTGELGAAGSARLEVEILKDGQTAARQTLQVTLDDAEGTRGVEIFALRPEARAYYATLLERANVHLEVRIGLDGRTVARAPLADLARAAEQVGPEGLQLLPVSVPAEAPEGLFRVTALDCTSDRNACLQQCEDDVWACNESNPKCEWCEECELAYHQCRDNCPECCTEPKSVTYTTYADPVAYSWSGNGCYTSYSGGGSWWDHYWVQWELTRYKHTEHCDGTVTTTVDATWYEYGDCWDEQLFSTCSNPIPGPPGPSC